MQHIYKQRWICRQCLKSLSSKRSYDEHMNIHNKTRPFACDECDYAAASQMTLRRHKLRNHIPRSDWGYQCPYCGEQYMEPASYQQHVIARHWGNSATFGCPYGDCTFTTKSSKFFREHLSKHQTVLASRAASGYSFAMPFKIDLGNIATFMINDECGAGNSSGKMKRRRIHINTRPQFTPVEHVPVHRKVNYQHVAVRFVDEGNRRITRINVEKLLDSEEDQEISNNKIVNKYYTPTVPRQTRFTPIVKYNSRNVIPQTRQFVTNDAPAVMDWIETEVVIDSEAEKMNQLPDGQVDDFGLD